MRRSSGISVGRGGEGRGRERGGLPTRKVLNSGERRARGLRDALKMQSNTTDDFPAAPRIRARECLHARVRRAAAPLSVSARGAGTMTGTYQSSGSAGALEARARSPARARSMAASLRAGGAGTCLSQAMFTNTLRSIGMGSAAGVEAWSGPERVRRAALRAEDLTQKAGEGASAMRVVAGAGEDMVVARVGGA